MARKKKDEPLEEPEQPTRQPSFESWLEVVRPYPAWVTYLLEAERPRSGTVPEETVLRVRRVNKVCINRRVSGARRKRCRARVKHVPGSEQVFTVPQGSKFHALSNGKVYVPDVIVGHPSGLASERMQLSFQGGKVTLTRYRTTIMSVSNPARPGR